MTRYSIFPLALGAILFATAPCPAAAEPPDAERAERDRERDRERAERDRERAERSIERAERRRERDRVRSRAPGQDGDIVIVTDGDGDGDAIEVIIETDGEGAVRVVTPPTPPASPVVQGRGRGLNWFGPPGGGGWQKLKNTLSTSRQVKGPVSIEVGVVEGEIEVVRGPANTIRVDVKNASANNLAIDGRGPRYEVHFDGSNVLRRGDVRLQIPPGSSVEVEAVSGNVAIKGVGGDVEVEAVSGDVTIEDANRVEVEAVSGDVRVERVRAATSVETVSGDARVVAIGKTPPRFEFSTTSGDLDWYGTCGSGCRMELESLSGRVKLHLATASTFKLDFESFSGALKENVGLKIVNQKNNRYGPGRSYRAQLGSGSGRIEAETHSGDLVLEKK